MGPLTTARLIALAKLEGIDLGRSPTRRIANLTRLGLLPRSTRVGAGNSKGVRSVFPPEAIEWLRAVDALYDDGIPFESMKKHLLKSIGREPRKRHDPQDEQHARDQWEKIIVGNFGTYGEPKQRKTVLKLLDAIEQTLAQAPELQAKLDHDQEFEKELAHLRRVGRMLWVMSHMERAPLPHEASKFLLDELRATYRRFQTFCGVPPTIGRRPPIPEQLPSDPSKP